VVIAVTGKAMAALAVTAGTAVSFRFLCSTAHALAASHCQNFRRTLIKLLLVCLTVRCLFNDAVIS
jgi:hypothetical protein